MLEYSISYSDLKKFAPTSDLLRAIKKVRAILVTENTQAKIVIYDRLNMLRFKEELLPNLTGDVDRFKQLLMSSARICQKYMNKQDYEARAGIQLRCNSLWD